MISALDGLLILVFCVVMVEVITWMPIKALTSDFVGTTQKALWLLKASSVSDHWKEKALLAYSRKTFTATIKILFALIIFFAIAAGIVLLFDYLSPGFFRLMISIQGGLVTLVAALVYAFVRSRLLRG